MSTADQISQREELEVLESIYPEIISYEGENSVRLNFDKGVRLFVKMPENYPSLAPPIFELSGPCLTPAERRTLINSLNDIFVESMGIPILFMWTTTIIEFLAAADRYVNRADLNDGDDRMGEEDSGNCSFTSEDSSPPSSQGKYALPEIFHGESFHDRKSHFQAHLARIQSKEQVKLVMEELKRNNKIARATHNIVAWRVTEMKNGREIKQHDCHDDGETGASSKMLDLLDKMGADNVIVVVTRWYGGIHLGPDRFRHINNLTRDIVTKHMTDQRAK